MAYPDNKPDGNYKLRDYDFATLDEKKIPMDEFLFKNGYKNAEESEVESVPDAHEQNWLFDILHRNLKYTLETAEENKNLLATKVATPTSIGQVKIGYGLNITSNGVLSVQKDIAQDANIISYDLPVGSYMLWAGNQPPEYFIEPAGQTLLRSSYAELWQFAQDNELVGKLFGEGDGQTTFTVTDIRGEFISIANSDEKVGKHTEAGLPNITGYLSQPLGAWQTSGNATGAFKKGKYTGWSGSDGARGVGKYEATFDASASNSIYGKSNTVTPANWGLKIILKALPTPPSNAVPTGTILDYTGKVAPDGYIIANGAELSRKTFSKLFQWANANGLIKLQEEVPNTVHAYYGSGDGATTFTIPDLRFCGLAYDSSDGKFGNYTPNGRKLIKAHTDGTKGYNIYSDGWCEQWGVNSVYSDSSTTVTLEKSYIDTNFRCLATMRTSFPLGTDAGVGVYPSATDKIVIINGAGGGRGSYPTTWYTAGYINISSSDYDTKLSGDVIVTPILKY